MIELRLLTTADVEDLYPRLRLEDKEETICLGSNPREALLMGAFDNVFTGISNGRAYALVNPSRDGLVIGAIGFTSSGYLWALSGKFTKGETMELFARTNEIVGDLLEEARKKGALFPGNAFLHNVIHARNKAAMKWLDRCGLFVLDRDNPIDCDGEVFYNFRTKMAHEFGDRQVALATPVASPVVTISVKAPAECVALN